MTWTLMLLILAGGADVRILTADGKKISATAISISGTPEKPVLEYGDADNPGRIACEDIVEIRFADAAPPPPRGAGEVEVTLTSGDRFLGTLAEGSESTLLIRTAAFGKTELPFESVRSIRSRRNGRAAPDRPEQLDEDLVIDVRGDTGRGTLVNVTGDSVTYYSSLLERDVVVPLEDLRVAYLAPMPDAPAPEKPKTLYAILESQDGSGIRGKILSLKDGTVRVRDLYGAERSIRVTRLASIHFRNGRVVYLSDIAPAEVRENANYIRSEKPLPSDLEIPWQKDLNARGGPITLRREAYRKGIGVHAQSSLAWNLEGREAARFEATVGLDDCGEGRGHVVFRVVVDGKVKFERPMGGADAPADVSVEVGGAKELRLEVDFGERANMSDYADWAAARLIR